MPEDRLREYDSPGHSLRDGSRVAKAYIVVLMVCGLAIAGLYLLTRDRSLPIAGTWVGVDAAGVNILYHFDADGSGYRTVAGRRDTMSYELSRGHPDLIHLVIGRAGVGVSSRGLLQIVSPDHIRLEVSPPGEGQPAQLGPEAIDLWRPATR
jgi:hypothetical protein